MIIHRQKNNKDRENRRLIRKRARTKNATDIRRLFTDY